MSSKQADTPINRVLDWFRVTPQGIAMQHAAREAETTAGRRVRARERFDAAEVRARQVPKLIAKRDAAWTAVWAAYEGLAAAERDLNAVVQSVGHDRDRAETALRDTADFRIHDFGPVLSALREASAHVGRHAGIAVQLDRELLADLRRTGDKTSDRREIEQRVEMADESETIRAALAAAIEAVRLLQLQPAPDVAAELAAIFETLPMRCPCGNPLNFAALDLTGADSASPLPISDLAGFA